MSTLLSKRVSLAQKILTVVNNAEDQFSKEQKVSLLADEVQNLVMDPKASTFCVRKTIELVKNHTSNDSLIIIMNGVVDMVEKLDVLNEQQAYEDSKKRAFMLQDMIISNRERLDQWTKEWEEYVWSSDEGNRERTSKAIDRIQKRLGDQVHEFENILNGITGEVRAEWAKDYFGR